MNILGPDGKPVSSKGKDLPPIIFNPEGKVANAPDTTDLYKTYKPTKMAFSWAHSKKRAQELNNANTCPGCGRNTYFPINSEICYDCAYKAFNTDKPGRNKPCPCGSEKKYKRCCGHVKWFNDKRAKESK